MAARTAAELVIDVTTNASKATAGFDDVASSAGGAERAVAKAGDTAERTSRQIGISADAADELGGKAGKATGALGALSSGFELMGPSGAKYAGGLQAAALATDFMSGVGDSLNLVMESTIVKNVRARAATIAHSIATKAAAAGTAVMTAAQWALNAALNANPVALVVLAVVALVAILALAYRRSERVRAIIDAVGKVGRQAIGFVVSKVVELVEWVGRRVPSAANAAKDLVMRYFRLMTAGPKLLVDAATSAVEWVRDKIPAAFKAAKDKAADVADAIAAPFRAVKDIIDKILDLIGRIKIPSGLSKLAGVLPGVRVAGALPSSGSVPVVVAGPTYQIAITVEGAIDPYSTAQQIGQLLSRYGVTFNV
jgi:hypothetical protein